MIICGCQRLVDVPQDGAAGPQTWKAIFRALSGKDWEASPAAQLSARVDERSEGVIATLLPEAQTYARALVHAAAAQGITIKVISGTRTYAEQDALYAKGRTAPGAKVTNARGGFSNHNFGIAFDVGIFSGAKYVEESPLYKVVGTLGKGIGLQWGGDWKSLVDEPHFEYNPKGYTLGQLRDRKSAGLALV